MLYSHFHCRGPLSNVDVKVSSGQLEVSKEKSMLVWVLGKSTGTASNPILSYVRSACVLMIQASYPH